MSIMTISGIISPKKVAPRRVSALVPATNQYRADWLPEDCNYNLLASQRPGGFLMKLKETEKAYLAGLIDGEGCIYITTTKKRYFRLSIILVGAVHDHIEEIARIADVGSTHYQKRKKPYADLTQWHISSNESLGLLKAILPYLILKKEQAKLAIRFQEHMNNSPNYNKWHPIPEAVLDYRLQLANMLKEMKTNGKTFNEKELDIISLPIREYEQSNLI